MPAKTITSKSLAIGRPDKNKHFTILRTLDTRLVERMKPGQLLHHYLLASLLYYHYDESPFEDHGYGRICERLYECYDAFEHPHKHIVEKDALTAKTGFYIKFDDYPSIVHKGLGQYINSINDGSLQYDLDRVYEIGQEAWLQEQRHNHPTNL